MNCCQSFNQFICFSRLRSMTFYIHGSSKYQALGCSESERSASFPAFGFRVEFEKIWVAMPTVPVSSVHPPAFWLSNPSVSCCLRQQHRLLIWYRVLPSSTSWCDLSFSGLELPELRWEFPTFRGRRRITAKGAVDCILLPVTLSDAVRFSKFFHRDTQQKICNSRSNQTVKNWL